MRKAISVVFVALLLATTAVMALEFIPSVLHTYNSNGKANSGFNTELLEKNTTKYFYAGQEITYCENPDVNVFDIQKTGNLLSVTLKKVNAQRKYRLDCFGNNVKMPVYVQISQI